MLVKLGSGVLPGLQKICRQQRYFLGKNDSFEEWTLYHHIPAKLSPKALIPNFQEFPNLELLIISTSCVKLMSLQIFFVGLEVFLC